MIILQTKIHARKSKGKFKTLNVKYEKFVYQNMSVCIMRQHTQKNKLKQKQGNGNIKSNIWFDEGFPIPSVNSE